jgi:hypothetical protein
MNCKELRDLLPAFHDGCLAAADRDRISAHLQTCPACAAEQDRITALEEHLQTLARSSPTPDLTAVVMKRLLERPREGSHTRAGRPGLSAAIGRLMAAKGFRLAATALAAAAIVILAVLWFFPPMPAWAIEQSIEVTRPYKGLHIEGVLGGRPCEMWIRVRADQAQMERLLFRMDGGSIWIDGNRTFHHPPGSPIVLVDDAQTAGFSHWPGPKFYELIRSAGIREVDYVADSDTGRRTARITAGIVDGKGATSWELEFDTESKLLVRLRQWPNLDRSGTPSFETKRIEYSKDIPDAVFAVKLPADTVYQPKAVVIAPETIGLLAQPHAGLPTDGIPEPEVCRRIVQEMWRAILSQDWARFRQLCPLAAGRSDEFLKFVVGGMTESDRVVEVLEVGTGTCRGESALGSVWVVPSRVRHGDGHVYEQKMIVQYRSLESAPSCVLYSGYGTPYRLD